MKRWMVIVIILVFLGASGLNLSGEESNKKTTLSLRTRTLSYLKAEEAVKLIRPYLSPRGTVRGDARTNTVVIMEAKDVADKIDKLVSFLDVRLTDVQFLVELILCFTDDVSSDKDLPKDPLLQELSDILKYRYFKRMGTTVIKVQHNTSSSHKISRDLDLHLKPMVSAGGDINVELELIQNKVLAGGKVLRSGIIETSLSIKDKERTVVGVSKLKIGGGVNDNALVLIISGKLLKAK